MRSVMAAALVLATMGQVGAIECPVSHAVYGQLDNEWSLRFVPVPPDGAANQIAAFTITMPGSPETVFDGGIYIPNGFGQAYGVVMLDAEQESNSPPFWEGPVYALVYGSIEEFPWDPDQPRDSTVSPDQILLPQFASNVWYSRLRAAAFDHDNSVLDTFTLATCVK